MRKRLEELKPYEDTGLTPEQIMGKVEALRIYQEQGLTPDEIYHLKERDTPKAPDETSSSYGYFICPNCGRTINVDDYFKSHMFCLNCGQRIKWED